MPYDSNEFKQKLNKSLEHLKTDISTLRTGRASTQLLDPVKIEAYGSQMRVQELANVSAPDASMVVVTPWDKNLLENIEKGIASAGLNLHPVVDGDIIRISIPPLTEERRKEMVKSLGQKLEQGKVMMRNIRNDAKKDIESLEGSEGMSEDDVKNLLEEMEDVFKNKLEELDQIGAEKEKELMTV